MDKLEYEEEDEDLLFFKNFCTEETEDRLETRVFSTADLVALKEKEKNLRAKEDSKYFRSKEIDSKLYEQIMECMKPYLTDNKLKMLMHPWSTQLNKAMNTLVSTYTPKTKTLCRTMSLKTRVGIAAAVQGLGYKEFWSRVFQKLGITMDDTFYSLLESRDRNKNSIRICQKSKGKLVRRKEYLAKFATAHEEQMNNAKTGKNYGSDIDLKAAKKSAKEKLTATMRNPKGTPKHLQRCAYYPHYCNVIGHTTVGNKVCGANNKTLAKRKALLAKIQQVTIDEELVLVQEDRKYIFSYNF